MRVETPAEDAMFCTVRLETEGRSQLHRCATSFIFAIDTPNGVFPCLVTNKHVIDGAAVGRFFFTRRGGEAPSVGNRVDIKVDDFEAKWYPHSDPEVDIAVMPLAPIIHVLEKTGNSVFYRQIHESSIPSPEQLAELDATEDIVFVGYPIGLYDQTNLLPVFRRGITATPPQIDYDGKPVFLVDASVFPGSSGSPVFIYNLAAYRTRKGLQTGTRFFFLGVISKVYFREEHGRLEARSIPTRVVPTLATDEMLDLGHVFKASVVVETVRAALSHLEHNTETQ